LLTIPYSGAETVYTGAFEINNLANANNNIDQNPLFVAGDLGSYYLSQIAAGQMQNSPAIDAGSDLAVNVGLDEYTTRTDSLTAPDGGEDVNEVDLGYHSPKTAGMPVYKLNIEVVHDPNYGPHGTVATVPVMENYEFYAGTMVTLVANPDFGYRVAYWEGTEADSSKLLTNAVIMYSDKTVRVEFETPRILKVKGDGVYPEFYPDIRTAIAAAQTGDVIEVYKGVYGGSVIPLNKNVYIRSRNPNDPSYVEDTIIDRSTAQHQSLAFRISSIIDNRTVIDGFTMINSRWGWGTWATPKDAGYNGGDGASYEGGCIFIDASASPIIKNCVIKDCRIEGGGGGRGHDADDTHHAGRGGWGGWARGGAVYCGTGSAPQFINCKFQNNEAVGGSGGDGGNYHGQSGHWANYGGNWSSPMSWEYPNIDPRLGGVMSVNTNMELWDLWDLMASSATDPFGLGGTGHPSGYYIDDGFIDGYYGNYSWYGGYGGAVYCGVNSDVNFINCEITGNTVYSGMSGIGGLMGTVIRLEPKVAYELPSFGAGVYCDSGSNTLFENCTISNNVASEMQGRYRLNPIISHGGGVSSQNTASVTFTNCHISENQADIGGGIYFANSNPLIEDCNIVDNIAMQGGGIYGNHGEADIIGCDIIGNQSKILEDPNRTFIIDGSGGGIHISSLGVNIVDCLISENIAEYSGGGLFFDGAAYQTVVNCLITDNDAGHDGGGIAVTTQAEPTISNCTITANRLVPISELGGSSALGGSVLPGPTTDGDDLSASELAQMEVTVSSSSSERPESVTAFISVQPMAVDGDIVIEDVPTSEWTYGSAATSAGMLFGYYDRNGFPKIYTGPTNDGVAPLLNLGQGSDPDNPIEGSCSLIATQNGFDGRETNGHVDDYWIEEGAEGPDPWEAVGFEHKRVGCVADFIGSSQWKWISNPEDPNSGGYNNDGEVAWWRWTDSPDKLHDYIPPEELGLPRTAFCHGMRLFAESRGYLVTENYNQRVDTDIADGFSFDDYKDEIDAGCPVLLQLTDGNSEHTMLGVGYNDETQEIIVHDTWDNRQHRMDWGGYYGDYRQFGVTVIRIEADLRVYGSGVDISHGGSANIVNTIIWDNNSLSDQLGVQLAVGDAYEPSGVTVSYSNIGPEDSSVYTDANCFVTGWDLGLYPDSNGWAPETYTINRDPLFLGDYLLSQIAAGQLVDSPSFDAGSDDANELGLHIYTTRTDSVPDANVVDMGYHHWIFDATPVELNFTAISDPDLGLEPVIDPAGRTYYNQYTTVELTVSEPPVNYQIQWFGTDDDSLVTTTNTIHMNTSKTVAVGYVKNYCILDVTIDGEGGSYELDPESDANGVYPRDAVVTIIALPEAGYRVKQWTGTADDASVELENTVVMDGDQSVTISFEQPSVISIPSGDVGSLQEAIDTARELDTIILASGTYRTQAGFEITGKNISISGAHPDDLNYAGATIIEQLIVEGGNHGGAFYFRDVGPETVLKGLTIRNFTINVTARKDADDDPNDFASRSGFNGGTLAGVAILCEKASLTVKNCIFENCGGRGGNGASGAAGVEASPNGGMGGWPGGSHGGAVAMYNGWDVDFEEQGPSNPTFINCAFTDCYVRGANGGNGGDAFRDDDKGIFGVPGLGGGWYYGEPYDYYYNIYIYWPWAYRFNGDVYSGDGQYDEYTRYSGLGGAVFVGSDCSPVFKGCNFEGNTSYGGFCGIPGLFGGDGANLRIAPAAPLKINSLGGAVYCDTNSVPYFYDCNFVNNEADVNIPAGNNTAFISYGGAVAARDNAKPVFEDCSFTGNLATVGGGIYFGNLDAKVIDCDISDNTAFHGGGLYYANGDGLIDGSTIANNYTVQPPDPNIFPDIIYGLGGGMYISASGTNVVDSEITMNSAGGSGGGVYLSDVDSSFTNCLVTLNTSGRDGGGISANWLSYLNVSNSTIADNDVSGIGFASPYNYGGGLYCSYGSHTNIIDSIFWGNSADSGEQLAVDSENSIDTNDISSTLEVSYSLVQGSGPGVHVGDECEVIWDVNNLYTNPLFVSGIRGDYFLSNSDVNSAYQVEDSPAIDAGSANASDLDLHTYTTRVDGKYDHFVVDMGYHYTVGNECRICDLNNSGKVEFGDLMLLAQYWLYSDTECTVDNNWCQGANLIVDDVIDFKDYAKIADCWMETSTDMIAEWLYTPDDNSSDTSYSIAMEATPVINSWGWDVEYYFECLEDANASSQWQAETVYEAEDLLADTLYSFRFKVREITDDLGESDWSTVEAVLTGTEGSDGEAPEPNPMEWEILPTALGPNSVEMLATEATDDRSEVEYEIIRTDPNSGDVTVLVDWETERYFLDDTVEPNSTYIYQVRAQDASNNRTAYSDPYIVTTPDEGIEPDTTPPDPNPSLWAARPSQNDITGKHTMAAVVANDTQNEPVWYYFYADNNGTDSGWQRDGFPLASTVGNVYTYSHSGGVAYQVQTTDTDPLTGGPNMNTSNWTGLSEAAATWLP